MRALPRATSLLLLALVLGAGVVAYQFAVPVPQPALAPKASTVLDFVPSEQQREQLAELERSLTPQTPRFASEQARARPNAKLFTYLAATSSERRVIEASLEAIKVAYSSRSEQKEAPDADLERTLLRHLGGRDPSTVALALETSRIPLMMEEPSPGLVHAIAEMAGPQPDAARRLAALEALDLLPPGRRSAEVLASFIVALGASEPQIIASSLFALEQSAPSFELSPKPSELGSRIFALSSHADPGVRGRALQTLVSLAWLIPPATRIAQLDASLGDPEPYVRAVAADGLARSGAIATASRLLMLAEDEALARYELRGYPTLSGAPGELIFALPGRRMVGEAALYALASLSSNELVLIMDGQRLAPADLAKNAAAARAWYARRSARPASVETGAQLR